jgi:hypothetical protein
MRALDAQVQELALDLDHMLLATYFQNHLWNEFVDRFLQFAQKSPGRAHTLAWAWSALECSQKCGREEEVTDFLRHRARFGEKDRIGKGFKAILEEWEAQIPPGPEVSAR